jgi:hypothetical protein
MTTSMLFLLGLALNVGCTDDDTEDTDDTTSEADADTDADADSDSDSDSDADSDADADADADADSDADADTDPQPDNMLMNPSFESGWDSTWLIFPGDRSNYAVIPNGESMYPEGPAFAAFEGTQAVKLYGLFTGWESETPIYQEFPAVAGETYTFKGQAFIYSGDPIASAQTYGVLWLKYFDNDYNYYGNSASTALSMDAATDTWTELSVTGTVPEGATKVQAAIEYWHCAGEAEGDCYDGGSVYFDDMLMYKVEE